MGVNEVFLLVIFYLMVKVYFFIIDKIIYSGFKSLDLLSFYYYDENCVIMGKMMKEYFCFVVVYWYSFCGEGVDFFGLGIWYLLWFSVVDFY